MLLSSCDTCSSSCILLLPFYSFLSPGTNNFSQAFYADSHLGVMEYVLWISAAFQELPPIPAHLSPTVGTTQH